MTRTAGLDSSGASFTTIAYDAAVNQWYNKANLITSRAELASVTLIPS